MLDGIPGVVLVDPIDYARMTAAVRDCTFVLTDSGGLQEEAPTLGKPVLVMRDTTERPEGLEAGTARLVGTETNRIVSEVVRLLDDPEHYSAMARAHNPFGDGRASERIVKVLLNAGTSKG